MDKKYKIKPGYVMRMVGGANMVVPIGPASREYKGMIRLNESGAWIFSKMQKGITLSELTAEMIVRYDGMDEASAKQDIHDFMNQIIFAISEI